MPDPTDALFTIEDYEDRQAWLAARRSGVGASESVALLDPRAPLTHTPYSLWTIKVGARPEEDTPGNTRMEFGHRLEPVIARWFTDHTAIPMLRVPNRILRRRDKPWLICSPDALDLTGARGLECKALDHTDARGWDFGLPPRYMVQVQHQLMVTGWRSWHVAVLFGGNTPRSYEVARDDKVIALLESRIDAFWKRVLDRDPPPLTARPAEAHALRLLFPASSGREVRLDNNVAAWANQFRRAQALSAAAERMRGQAEAVIRAVMRDADVALLPDGSRLILAPEGGSAGRSLSYEPPLDADHAPR